MVKALHTAPSVRSRIKGAPVKGRPGKGHPGKGRPGKGRTPVGKKGKAGRTRQPVKGASRKVVAPSSRPPRSAAWLNRVLILSGAAVVLAAAVQAYLVLERIPVQRISVTGDLEHTRAEAVQAMVQPALAGGFLNADLQRIRTELEALPWIYRVSVRRKWPNALEINVAEQLPIARWGTDGFLNHEGEVFRSSNSEQWQSLPILRGPEGAARSLVASYQRLADTLRPLGLAVQQLSVDERAQVNAQLSGGVELALGGDDFKERMQRLVTVYHSELAGRMAEVQRIDLRYASGIAVAFREPVQVAGSEL